MLTDSSFQNLSTSISGTAEAFTLKLLKRLRSIALALVRDPSTTISISEQAERIASDHDSYVEEAEGWVDENLSVAYLRGIQETNGQIEKLEVDAEATQRIPSSQVLSGGSGGDIADKAAEVLKKYPEHHTMYSVFQESAYEDFANTRVPVVRDARGKIRDITIQASESQYRNADTFTRRQMSQELMNRFADNNITGIVYEGGRRVKLDSYSEMIARTQTGNAARQASMNRQQQYGFDLVRISSHSPCSDLCVDWQGKVYSLSGDDSKYPPLDEAIAGGLYHPNCKHFQNLYLPGISPSLENPGEFADSKGDNRKAYEAEQKQRYNESKIKQWKRREASALTDSERDKAKGKIRDWQARNKELVDSNDFLRRKYERESI